MTGEINDMGNMVCGAETTPEEEFIYSQEMVEFIDKWEKEFYNRKDAARVRLFLEAFAWALKQKIDEEG